jgi:predicted dienelactone hydrolase
MLRARVIVAAALSVFTVACAEPPKRANPVGLSFAAYADTARRSWTGPEDRPLATAVWYPAAPGSREAEWRVGIFNAGWNARKAALSAATAKRPLIVLSHGTGGGAAGMAWLAETLASNGYIVAAVNHHGNTAAEPSYQLQGFMLWWDRARDISTHLESESQDSRWADIPRWQPLAPGSRMSSGRAFAPASQESQPAPCRRKLPFPWPTSSDFSITTSV